MGRIAERALEVASQVVKFDAKKSEMQLEKLKDYEHKVREASNEISEAQTGEAGTHIWTAIGAVAVGIGAKMVGLDNVASFGPSFIKELGSGIATYKRKDQTLPQVKKDLEFQKLSALNEQRANAQRTGDQVLDNAKRILEAEHRSKESASNRR